MPDIQVVVLDTTVRVGPGKNDEQTTTLDCGRKAHEMLTLKEAAAGVQVWRDGALFSLIPWGQIRQVVYAPDRQTLVSAAIAALSAEDKAALLAPLAPEKAAKK